MPGDPSPAAETAPGAGATEAPAESQQGTLEALRQAMSRLESGETTSTLFEAGAPAADSAPGVAEDSAGGDRSAGSDRELAAEEPRSEEAPAGDEHDRARNIVLRKLTGSAKSRHQLAEALREKDVAEDVVGAVLDRFEEVQLIDDAAFARTWVRTRHETRGLGRSALRRELQDRGVTGDQAEEALEQLSAEDEDSAARELIAKKLRGVTVPPGQDAAARKERDRHTRRLVSMLARRGHSPGAAFQLAREALEEHTPEG